MAGSSTRSELGSESEGRERVCRNANCCATKVRYCARCYVVLAALILITSVRWVAALGLRHTATATSTPVPPMSRPSNHRHPVTHGLQGQRRNGDSDGTGTGSRDAVCDHVARTAEKPGAGTRLALRG